MSTTVVDPWEIEVKKGGGEQYTYHLCPSGSKTATLAGIFHVGTTTERNKEGETYKRDQVLLVFELVMKNPDGEPFRMTQLLTRSMHENSNLYKVVSAILGQKQAEGATFDPRTLLGMPCTCSIVHTSKVNKKNETKTYHGLDGVSGWSAEDDEGNPKKRPSPTVPVVAWSVLEGKPLPELPWVPRHYGETLADLVKASDEYKQGTMPAIAEPAETSAAPAGDDDDIPF